MSLFDYLADKIFGSEDVNSTPIFKERFCPNCSSNKVEPYHDNGWSAGALLSNLDEWKCRECEYIGVMPERTGQEEENFEFEPEKYEPKDYNIHNRFKRLEQIAVILLLMLAAYVWILYPLI